jgi:haloalkane dehalogenase
MAPIMAKLLPGARGLDHPTIEHAGHFLQEDAGPELGRVVADFMLG